MPAKTKESADKAPVLKGQEAEDRILSYLRKMNRPYGAVDVCANLKGAVPKATTQKILVALAEKGEVTQKTYAKSTFFVAKQSNLEDIPAEKLSALEEEQKKLEEENKVLVAEVKTASTDIAKLKSTPTDEELTEQISDAKASIKKTVGYLQPLRAGTSLISAEEIEQLDKEWAKWRAEWLSRRKVFLSLWHLVADSLAPQDAKDLAEDLGIEYDSNEHESIERGPLCNPPRRK